MNEIDPITALTAQQEMSPEFFAYLVQQSEAEATIALLLTYGLLSITVASICMLLGWRRLTALFTAFYALCLFFIPADLTKLLAPIVLLASVLTIAKCFLLPKPGKAKRGSKGAAAQAQADDLP